MISTILAINVAKAAPLTPIAGSPARPKINAAFNTIFIHTVTILIFADSEARFVSFNKAKKHCEIPVSKYDQPAIFKYSTPILISTLSFVKSTIKYLGKNTQPTKNNTEASTDIFKPIKNTLLRDFSSFLPQY